MADDGCGETIRDLEKFLDNELSDDARSQIQEHLDGCVDCLQAFDFQAELRAVIRLKCRNDEIPPGLLAKIERCFDTDFDGDGIIG
ncbi:MAG TPA: zf-HC2 domain-containing protein [Ilumatobacteraceae bacterium]|nr:zf-HC2 domain-containing protein [Ilumatobacteraceae bacterium]